MISIELDGAADAKYFISVPLGGGPVYTSMYYLPSLILRSSLPPCDQSYSLLPQNSLKPTQVRTNTNNLLPIDNALSISQVRSTYNIPNCKFDTVDYTPAFVQIASGVW